jgi:hypothetical protein
MYAPVESINHLPLDLFLINQINTTKNNSVSFLELPVEINNKKVLINDIKLSNNINFENITGYELDNKYENSLV